MRTKVTLVLIFLNVALFFFIFYIRPRFSPPDQQTARRRVLPPEAANLQSIEIKAGTQTIRLTRRGEAWSLTTPFEWPANPHAVNRILTELQTLDHETMFEVSKLAASNLSLADYGLQNPAIVLILTAAAAPGQTTTPAAEMVLRIGNTTNVDNRLYVLSPDGQRIHVVNRSLADSLTLPVEQLRAENLFTIPEYLTTSFNLQTAAPANLRIRLKREGNRWLFETPIAARASTAVTRVTLGQLGGLKVKSFLTQPPSPELSPENPAAMRLTLEGNNRRETLLLGGAVPTAAANGAPGPTPGAVKPTTGAAAPPPPPTDFYAQIEGRPVIFVVPISAALLKTLQNAQEDLRDPRLLDCDMSAVTALTLRAPNRPEITLQRLEATNAESVSWQLVRRTAAGASNPQPADTAAVQHLLARLEQLSALKFLSDAPTSADEETWGFNRPEREVALTLATPARGTTAGPARPGSDQPATLTLQIGVGAQRGPRAYARLDQARYVYEIDADMLQATAMEPLAWRDRRLRELPAGARITTLRLTETLGGKEVYLLRVGASGGTADAKETPARQEAGQKLLGQLRTLRAKEFVRDRFAPTVTILGEERPWKYQLDITVELTGGASVQSSVYTLFFSERVGGATQLAGAPDLDAIFSLEQPLVDALWTLLYGPQDPGPNGVPEAKKP